MGAKPLETLFNEKKLDSDDVAGRVELLASTLKLGGIRIEEVGICGTIPAEKIRRNLLKEIPVGTLFKIYEDLSRMYNDRYFPRPGTPPVEQTMNMVSYG